MTALDEKLAKVGFVEETKLSDTQIREAGARAIEAGRRFMASSIKETSLGDQRIDYSIVGPGGIVTQMTFSVTWADKDDSLREVTLTHYEYLTMQPKIYHFIPTGSKQAPALVSYQRFADALRRELVL